MARATAALMMAGAVALGANRADACPVCDRESGRAVRAGIFGTDFGPNLLAVVLPFGALLGLVAALRFGPFPGDGPVTHESRGEGA